jgi:hypothetical protein
LNPLIPGIEPRVLLYDPVDPKQHDRQGSFILQYDNKHPDTNDRVRPIARFLVEGVAQPDMRWDPLQGQMRKRDEEESNFDSKRIVKNAVSTLKRFIA